MNPVYETMTRVPHKSGFTFRVWREEPKLTFGPDEEVMEAIIHQLEYNVADAEDVINAVCLLPRINAIEVLDATGNGGLFYPDWN